MIGVDFKEFSSISLILEFLLKFEAANINVLFIWTDLSIAMIIFTSTVFANFRQFKRFEHKSRFLIYSYQFALIHTAFQSNLSIFLKIYEICLFLHVFNLFKDFSTKKLITKYLLPIKLIFFADTETEYKNIVKHMSCILNPYVSIVML